MWTMTSQSRQLVIDFKNELDVTQEISPLVKEFLRAWIKPLESKGINDTKLIIYLIYMTDRLILLKKVLSEEGSIYLHCDPTASHYLKIIMDGILDTKILEMKLYGAIEQEVLVKSGLLKNTTLYFFIPKQINIPLKVTRKKYH